MFRVLIKVCFSRFVIGNVYNKLIVITNTHCRTQNINDDFVQVYDMSDVILRGLKI